MSFQIAQNLKQHQPARDLKTQGSNGLGPPSHYLLNSYVENPQAYQSKYDELSPDQQSREGYHQ